MTKEGSRIETFKVFQCRQRGFAFFYAYFLLPEFHHSTNLESCHVDSFEI